MKWSWAGHINRLKDDRWTSRVTAWRPYDKKRRQGRPAKRWRDDLDKYWSDTIWQRVAQDRVIWRRHAEAFAQPRDTRVVAKYRYLYLYLYVYLSTILSVLDDVLEYLIGKNEKYLYLYLIQSTW